MPFKAQADVSTDMASAPGTSSSAQQIDAHASAQTAAAAAAAAATVPFFSISVIKLASSGIIMLRLHDSKTSMQEPSKHIEGANIMGEALPSNKSPVHEIAPQQTLLDTLPVRVVQQILEDLHGGHLAAPE